MSRVFHLHARHSLCCLLSIWLAGTLSLPLMAQEVQEPVTPVPTEDKQAEGFLDTPQDDSPATPDANQLNPSQAAALQNAKQSLLQSTDKITPLPIPTESELETSILEITEIFLKNDLVQARERLIELRNANPEFPPADLVMATFFFTVGNTVAAIQNLELAAKNHPEYPSTYSGFARIAVNQNRFTDAYALVSVAKSKLDEGSWSEKQREYFRIEILDSLIDVETNRGQWNEALTHLEELRALLPDNAKVSLKLAQVHFELGEHEKALENLNITKQLSNELRAPEVILADWHLIKRNLDESKKWIEKAIELYPEQGDVFLDYSRWLLRNNQLPQAAEMAKKAEQLGADNYRTTFVKGQVAFTRRAYDLAEMHFSRLYQMRPGDIEASNLLTLSLVESGIQEKNEKALQLAVMNSRVYPQNTVIAATLGWVYFKTGRMNEAQQIFRNLVNIRPMPPATGYFLASFLAANDETQNAANFLQASLETDGFFMYRASAEQLLKEVNQKLAAEKSAQEGESPESGSDANDGDSNDSPDDGESDGQ